ncbi:MFS transporter [Chloroflexota bacterium]
MNNETWPLLKQQLYRQRWRILIVAALAHTIGMFHRAAMGPIADRIMADFSITAVTFGSLSAVYFYTYAAMQIPSGTLADTWGPRRTIACGVTLSVLGSTLMGVSPSIAVLFVGRLLIGLGVSVAWLSCIKLIMEWFKTRERGIMIGLAGALANIGQLAATTPLAMLVMWIGWRMSLVAIGQISLIIAIANWLFVRDNPMKIGLPNIESIENQDVIKGLTTEEHQQFDLAQRFRVVFTNKHLWLLFLFFFGLYGAYSTLVHSWTVFYVMQTYGVSRDFATNFTFISTISHIISVALAGFLSYWLRRRKLPAVLFGGIFIVSLLILTFWNGGKPPLQALYLLYFFIGLGTGAIPILFAIVGDLVHPSLRGLAGGLINSGLFIGSAIAQPVFGYILDLGWQGEIIEGARVFPLSAFQHGFFLCCALATLGFISILFVKETYCRPVYMDQG